MNRTFTAALTPRRARQLVRMHKYNPFGLDEKIIAEAEIDRITQTDFEKHNIPVEDHDAVQFLIDSNFRAGLPVKPLDHSRGARVVNAAIAIAGIPNEEIVAMDSLNSAFTRSYKVVGVDLDFQELLSHRKKLLIFNIDSRYSYDLQGCADLIALMYPRMLCVGSMTVQLELSFTGTSTSTGERMGELLYPRVHESLARSTWKKLQPRSLLAMGVYPEMAPNINLLP